MNRIVAILLNLVMIRLCGGEVWELAQALVKLYEDKDLTGAEKREQVLAMLQVEAQTLAQSLVNLAIEAAIQYVRRKTSS